MMRKLLAAAGVMLALAAFPAVAGDQDFTLKNQTGYTIEQVYVAASKSNDWEEDVMGDDVLKTGANVDITFDAAENVCRFDIKVVYDDKEEAIWSNLDLCTISAVTVRYNRSTGATSAVTDRHLF